MHLLAHVLSAVIAGAAGCPSGTTLMATLDGQPVCESFSQLNGSLTLPASGTASAESGGGAPPLLRLSKRLYAQHTTPSFGNSTLQALNQAPDDLMGKAFLALAAAEGRDVSYDEILTALPPIISGWGDKPNFVTTTSSPPAAGAF